jgi:hypothetical protein
MRQDGRLSAGDDDNREIILELRMSTDKIFDLISGLEEAQS